MPYQLRVNLYHAIISPHFDYCSTILYLISETDQQKFQKLQNKAMRFVLNCDKYSKIEVMLETLQWQSIRQRICFNTLIFFYKIKNNMLPSYLTSNIEYIRDVHHHNTRRVNDIKLPAMTKSSTQNSLYYKGANQFNNLPSVIKNDMNFNSFKRKLNVYIKQII